MIIYADDKNGPAIWADHSRSFSIPLNWPGIESTEFRFGPDPLTLVLESIRLRCMMPGVNEMTAPWAVTFGEMKPAEMRRHAESIG